MGIGDGSNSGQLPSNVTNPNWGRWVIWLGLNVLTAIGLALTDENQINPNVSYRLWSVFRVPTSKSSVRVCRVIPYTAIKSLTHTCGMNLAVAYTTHTHIHENRTHSHSLAWYDFSWFNNLLRCTAVVRPQRKRKYLSNIWIIYDLNWNDEWQIIDSFRWFEWI